VARAAAVVDEADDGADAESAQAREARIRPGPVGAVGAVGRGALPEDGVAHGAEAQAGEEFEVAGARGVAAALKLVEVLIPDPVDGALHAAPQFERLSSRRVAARHGQPPRRLPFSQR